MSENAFGDAVRDDDRSAEGEVRDVVIVGSGPAGYTAAIYTARALLRPLVLEGSVSAGGALMNTTEVENFPGFRGGVQGPELMVDMRSQAERFGAELVTEDVVDCRLTGPVKVVVDSTGTVYRARSVIIATGSGYRELGAPNEQRLAGRGVSWCATCDGAFFRGEEIVVVGGGDTALEEAIFLTRFARSVTVVHRRGALRASKVMQARAFANDRIRMLWNTEVVDILGEDRVRAVEVRDVGSGQRRVLATAAVFVAIGHQPRSELVAGQLECDADGYVRVDHPFSATKVAGVFACGDVVDRHFRQAITAAASGCVAALDVERYLSAAAAYPVAPAGTR